ncbi:MAG TPA: flagellar protein FliT [Burkholderiaceae bacterium]|nr:flagellar protein FliT [Burkholderiaceae bacterium]
MAAKNRNGSGNPKQDLAASLMDQYEKIAQASRSMLEAAHRGDWDRVEEIAARCRELIATLKQARVTDALGDAEKRRRIALLRSILNDDAQIRARAQPWLRTLEKFLGSVPHPPARAP